MTELYQIIVLRVGVVLLAALAVVSAFVWLVHACRCVGRQLKTLTLVVMSFVAIVATVLAQKNGETWKRYWGPMLPFRRDAIQHKIDQWEGDGASQYQIETLDLSSFGEIVNQQ